MNGLCRVRWAGRMTLLIILRLCYSKYKYSSGWEQIWKLNQWLIIYVAVKLPCHSLYGFGSIYFQFDLSVHLSRDSYWLILSMK